MQFQTVDHTVFHSILIPLYFKVPQFIFVVPLVDGFVFAAVDDDWGFADDDDDYGRDDGVDDGYISTDATQAPVGDRTGSPEGDNL